MWYFGRAAIWRIGRASILSDRVVLVIAGVVLVTAARRAVIHAGNHRGRVRIDHHHHGIAVLIFRADRKRTWHQRYVLKPGFFQIAPDLLSDFSAGGLPLGLRGLVSRA